MFTYHPVYTSPGYMLWIQTNMTKTISKNLIYTDFCGNYCPNNTVYHQCTEYLCCVGDGKFSRADFKYIRKCVLIMHEATLFYLRDLIPSRSQGTAVHSSIPSVHNPRTPYTWSFLINSIFVIISTS